MEDGIMLPISPTTNFQPQSSGSGAGIIVIEDWSERPSSEADGTLMHLNHPNPLLNSFWKYDETHGWLCMTDIDLHNIVPKRLIRALLDPSDKSAIGKASSSPSETSNSWGNFYTGGADVHTNGEMIERQNNNSNSSIPKLRVGLNKYEIHTLNGVDSATRMQFINYPNFGFDYPGATMIFWGGVRDPGGSNPPFVFQELFGSNNMFRVRAFRDNLVYNMNYQFRKQTSDSLFTIQQDGREWDNLYEDYYIYDGDTGKINASLDGEEFEEDYPSPGPLTTTTGNARIIFGGDNTTNRAGAYYRFFMSCYTPLSVEQISMIMGIVKGRWYLS